MRMIVQLTVTGLIFLIAGCGSEEPRATRTTTPEFGEAVVAGCVVGEGGKADRRCDPGVPNPVVTPETLKDTICRPEWVEEVRPPWNYMKPLKLFDMGKYGLQGGIDEYWYDPLIPLELGGSPTNPDNLWPQPVEASYRKNTDGGRLKDRVCAGTMGLAAAQEQIVAEWSHSGEAAP